ncbi:FadR/GntR family transcriptional regulator [Ensifer sp. Root127]|uniref:FadR/GntR family transcriptional regulator n=1 Tax=Ensifer sp. Root127 TaxID=1736440 RepID=UPI00070BD412|nr:FadR/GntR family transcriptional regulator [Ensifer sp. Root127]KQW65265.1 GntR family transcriptional regulator [Ensifer sp. Root127]
MNTLISAESDSVAGTERVLSFFREQLLSGALKEGDRLLGERELCLALGVSRPVLREALRSLANYGFLDIRHGKGAFVRKADIAVLGDFLTFCLAQQPDMVDDIMQARIAIECQAIRLACSRATDGDLSRIGGLLSTLMETLDDAEDGGAADFAFHLALVEASRSPALITIYHSIATLLKRSHVQRRIETSDTTGIRDYLVEAHREVYLSVLARDPDEAETKLRQHFAIGDKLRRKSYIAAFARKGLPEEK